MEQKELANREGRHACWCAAIGLKKTVCFWWLRLDVEIDADGRLYVNSPYSIYLRDSIKTLKILVET